MDTKIVIFDFDGTLADTRDGIVRTMQATMQRLSMEMCSAEQCAATIGLTLRDSFITLYNNLTDEEADRCVATYREIYFEDVAACIPRLFDHVAETIQSLYDRDITLSIASSRSSPSLLLYLRETHIDRYFKYVVGSDSVTHHKPHPESIYITLNRLGYSASDALVVGDMPVDMEMARNAGVRVCGVAWGNATREELIAAGADIVIDDIRELLTYINK